MKWTDPQAPRCKPVRLFPDWVRCAKCGRASNLLRPADDWWRGCGLPR